MYLHCLNADFDISLRSRFRRFPPGMERMVKAMTLHGLFTAGEEDAVLLRALPADDFAGYLASHGIPMPAITVDDRGEPDKELAPFGWNEEMVRLNRSRHRPAEHPDPGVVGKVNSRSFSAGLEAELDVSEARGRAFTSTGAIEEAVAGGGGGPGGWVVKAEHGNAALGNRRLRGPSLADADRRFIENALAGDDRVVLEKWHEREADMTAVFHLAPSGELKDFRVHEAVYTSDGALIGVVFAEEAASWKEHLAGHAERVAAALVREGYFGPVCFDAYTFREGGGTRLRPLVDLNCRRAMSDGAHRLWQERFYGSTFYWRFFTGDKLVPHAAEELKASDMALRAGQSHGVLLTSPWKIEIDGRTEAIPKLGVAFIGETRAEVLAMESRFRERWER